MAPTEPDPDAQTIAAAHRRAQRAGVGFYVDPSTGYIVMTADTLLARGECCGSGCRHCPWPESGTARVGACPPGQ